MFCLLSAAITPGLGRCREQFTVNPGCLACPNRPSAVRLVVPPDAALILKVAAEEEGVTLAELCASVLVLAAQGKLLQKAGPRNGERD